MSKNKDIVHKEKIIILTHIHKIPIDECIADEIQELNNKKGILTLSSCCGHGKKGYIIVCGADINQMLELGYTMTPVDYLDNDIMIEEDRFVICGFKPKSKCNCIVE